MTQYQRPTGLDLAERLMYADWLSEHAEEERCEAADFERRLVAYLENHGDEISFFQDQREYRRAKYGPNGEYQAGGWELIPAQQYLDDTYTLSYSDVGHGKEEEGSVPILLPQVMSGGHYADSCQVEVSNHRVFLERFAGQCSCTRVDGDEATFKCHCDASLTTEIEKAGTHQVVGGHGTYGVAIEINKITPAMLDVLEALDNYPIIDESDLSECETESQNEAWENWLRHDFQRELVKTYPDLADDIEDLPANRLWELFWIADEEGYVNWVYEPDAYCRIEDVMLGVSKEDVESAIALTKENHRLQLNKQSTVFLLR